MRRALVAVVVAGVAMVVGAGPAPRLRWAHRSQRRGEPGADDDARRLCRRGRALRDVVRVHRRGRRVRLDRAAARRADQRRAGRRLDPAAPGARGEPRRGAAGSPTAAAGRRPRPAEELLETQVDALDITVLKGGGTSRRRLGPRARLLAVARRARGARLLRRAQPHLHGRPLRRAAGRRLGQRDRRRHPDPPHDPDRPSRGCRCASSASARQPSEPVEADVFLLTDDGARAAAPAATGLDARAQRGRPRRRSSTDLRSDKGMEWVPASMWLSYLKIDTPAGALSYDLAVDVNGYSPSPRAAGLPWRRCSRRSRRRPTSTVRSSWRCSSAPASC